MSSELREDLALASSSEGLTLASAADAERGSAVVTAVEQTAPRKRAPAPSMRAPRPRPAPVRPIEAAQEPEQEQELEVAAREPTRSSSDGLSSLGDYRTAGSSPQPAESSGGTGPVIRSGGGPDVGAILVGIAIGTAIGSRGGGGWGGSILRGGVVIDRCDPRTDGRRRVVNGTFGGFELPVRDERDRGGSTMAINDRLPSGSGSRSGGVSTGTSRAPVSGGARIMR